LFVNKHCRPAAVAAWLHEQGIARPGFPGHKIAVLHPVEISGRAELSGKEDLGKEQRQKQYPRGSHRAVSTTIGLAGHNTFYLGIDNV
jgi:hypothetical protein